MNVLINAYSVGPNYGSEPGVGWNWISEISNYCNLFIICEGEYQRDVEEAVLIHPNRDRLHFYFIPLPEKVRNMCSNQGNWLFYLYYKQWQKKALEKAKEICSETKIDIIHQLNMVGFREPGYLWKLGIPLVWGPIGGMGETPKAYLEGESIKRRLFLTIKDKISDLQLKYSRRIDSAFRQANALISAVPIAQEKILKYKKRESVWIPETGCYDLNTIISDKRKRKDFHILWVGRFIYTKRLDIALRTIAEIKDLPNLHFHILGTGSEQQINYYKRMGKELGIEDLCVWHGRLDNQKVHEMMRNADLFFFTSIREATSTVIPEAINNCLPILCFNGFGFGPLVTEKIGLTIEMTKPEISVSEFAEKIRLMYNDKEMLYGMSLNCHDELKKLLWEDKAKKVFEIYNNVIN